MPNKSQKLGCYVYVYTDPRNGKPFYVGQGRGERALAHLGEREKSRLMGDKAFPPIKVRDKEKQAIITAIYNAGKVPQIDILRYGLTEDKAHLVEAVVIDLIDKGNLTNKMSGKTGQNIGSGRTPPQELLVTLNAKSVEVEHKSVLFNLNRDYTYGMSPDALYDVTHCCWRVDRQRANKAEYAMAIHKGIVRAVYRIKDNSWYPAPNRPGRSGFQGEEAEESIRKKYVGNFVRLGKKGAQNPVRYAGFK